jgi:hypothetical protein
MRSFTSVIHSAYPVGRGVTPMSGPSSSRSLIGAGYTALIVATSHALVSEVHFQGTWQGMVARLTHRRIGWKAVLVALAACGGPGASVFGPRSTGALGVAIDKASSARDLVEIVGAARAHGFDRVMLGSGGCDVDE